MVSKELLSEVLDIEIKEIGKLVEGALLSFRYPTHWGYCNIYELAHRCKEWAFKQGFMFDIQWHTNRSPFSIVIKSYGKDSQFYCATTEPEAIFKATSYIMEQLKQKD